MAINKVTSGDYSIYVGPGSGNSWQGKFSIYGNLDVVGNVTYIDTTELEVTDPFITVGANNNGTYTNLGVVAQWNTDRYAGLKYDSANVGWYISANVTSSGDAVDPYLPIATGNIANIKPGSPANSVQFNVANAFTGSGNFLFDGGTSTLTLTGKMAFGNTAIPSSVANSVVLYSNAMGSGGTGLYFVNGSTNDELVSKSAAIVFSIIF
jgi:hypothetical protein